MNDLEFDLEPAALPGVVHETWLLGQPTLSSFLKFVRDKTVGGAELSPRSIASEWSAAKDYYDELQEREAGIADEIECLELDEAMLPLAEAVKSDPRFIRTYDSLPTTFGMVELEKLVVFQPHVTQEFVEKVKQKFGPSPDPETLFRCCMPLDREEPPIKVQRFNSRRYLFSGRSSDIRFHEAALLKGSQITNYQAYGPIGAVIGLFVGFGSNFLNVIRDENKRILLHNGYHRAMALRQLGITHAPCIIQSVTRRDELAEAASSAVSDSAFYYFGTKRPPLLKDFFDPKIRKVLPVRAIRRVIEIQFEVREFEVPE